MRRLIHSARGPLFFFFLLFVVIARGQDLYSVAGRVIDRSGTPLMGNAMALAVSDSAMLQGVSFLEGDFVLTGLHNDEVLIKLTSIQFADTVFRVRLAGRERVDLGTVVVTDLQMLDEVEITGDVPLFATRPDGVLQINVANTVLATSSSLNEILTRAPGVISDDDGLSVFGKGLAILYLNGKRITPERLAAVSAAQMKSVEIITNPPASFDAEGQAVINIITHAPLEDGYQVGINQQLTWSEFAGGLTQTLLNGSFKKGRFDLIGNYDFRRGKDHELLNTTRVRENPDDYLHSQLRWDADRDVVNVSNYSLGASYALSPRMYASLQYNGFYENVDELWQSRNYITTAVDDGEYTSRTNRDGLIRNNSAVLNLQATLDTLGSTLFVGGQLSRYRSGQDDGIYEYNVVDGEPDSRLLHSVQEGTITIYSPQTDLVKVFSRGSKLGIGAKLSYANVGSNLVFYNKESDEPVVDTRRSNEFSYEEAVPAAYMQYDGSINERTTFGVGLRSELTHYTLRTTVEGKGTFRSQYVNLFPSAQLAFTVSPEFKLRGAYTSRIQRPQYQALSPTLIYQDAFTSQEGNPGLVPEKVHAFELGAVWRLFDLKAGYTYRIDKLEGAALRGDGDKNYVLTRINIKESHTYFASASASFSARWFTSNNTVSVTYERFVDDQHDFVSRTPRPQVYLYSNNKIHAGKLFSLQLLAWYLGEKYYGIYYGDPRGLLTLGIEKEFLNKKLKCTLTANDMYHTAYPAGNYHVGGTNIVYARKFNTDYYRFIVTYSFGQLKKTSYKNRSTGDDENSRVR